jgi:transposase
MESKTTEARTTKRRARSKQERRQIVEETFGGGASVTKVARAHGIRPNQVFHWRRLYQRGLLGNEAQTTALVPVRITDATEDHRKRVDAAAQARRSAGRSASGTIQVELERARICISGAADAASLRMVLESLLG